MKRIRVFYTKPELFGQDRWRVRFDPTDYVLIEAYEETDDRATLGYIWRAFNVVTGDEGIERPLRLKCRSMCVGDIVEVDGDYQLCGEAGWYPLGKEDAVLMSTTFLKF